MGRKSIAEYVTTILQFEEQGEKTGWTYIEVPADIAQQLKPGNKKSFRVKGRLDHYAIRGIALLPMGNSNFIMALNAAMRKGIGKRKGATLKVQLEADETYVIQPPAGFMECLEDEPEAQRFFHQLPKSHQHYYFKWIDSAKTEPTRIKRISQAITALSAKKNFGEMMRMFKANRS